MHTLSQQETNWRESLAWMNQYGTTSTGIFHQVEQMIRHAHSCKDNDQLVSCITVRAEMTDLPSAISHTWMETNII